MMFLMLVGAHSHPKHSGSTRDSAKDRWSKTHQKLVPVQLALRKRNIKYKFEFLRRQYHAGSLNFLIGTLFARGTVFAIARATW